MRESSAVELGESKAVEDPKINRGRRGEIAIDGRDPREARLIGSHGPASKTNKKLARSSALGKLPKTAP